MIGALVAIGSRFLSTASTPWLMGGAAVLVLSLLTGTYAKGRMDSTAAWESKENVRLLADAKRRVKLQEENDKLSSDLEIARASRDTVVQTIIKKVPVYVKAPPAACADSGLHSPGFRVLYDSTVAGTVPDPASVATAAPVQAPEAAESILRDLAGCIENANKVEGWQAWHELIKKPKQ